MPQEVLRQSNFTGGELDPQLLGRRDLKAYLASCSSLSNCITTPQGPILRRPGTAFVDRVRDPLVLLDHGGYALTAPNGGTAENARTAGGEGFVTTAPLGTVAPYVILSVDLGATREVTFFDVVDLAVVPGGTAPYVAPDPGAPPTTGSSPSPPPPYTPPPSAGQPFVSGGGGGGRVGGTIEQY